MSKERELLRKLFESGMLDRLLTTEVGQLLAQPEQEPKIEFRGLRSNGDSYSQEPLSEDEIWKGIKSEHPISRSSFTLGVKFGEKEHGIGNYGCLR